MKHAYVVCLALGLAVGTAHAADCQGASARLLDNLDRSDYADATADFDDRMKAALGTDRLTRIWAAVSQQFGSRGAREQPRLSQVDGHTLVITPVHYGQHLIDVRVACDGNGRIGGLHIRPQHGAMP
ncbi:DUF3887 domain-containing protein [Rhodanobacter terrae]|uniref:DUF3887 domain-containing protein n=1 Tax=Rhodanobacter terrae TaxID=418647 RepID=A0ABW0SRS4_9GAMM